MRVVPLPLRMIFSLVVMGLIGFFFHLYNTVWLKPERIRKKLRIQGIKGPPPSFLYGNLSEIHKIQSQATEATNHAEIVAHDYTSTLFPYFELWRKEYGMFLTLSFRLPNIPAPSINYTLSSRLNSLCSAYRKKRKEKFVFLVLIINLNREARLCACLVKQSLRKDTCHRSLLYTLLSSPE